jgi:autotransporter-associated beta strand protein
MKENPRLNTRQLFAVALTAMLTASVSPAAVINKADNTTALNAVGSWAGGVVPGAADIALWDSTVATVNNTTNTLGANLSFAGIKIVNPVAKIQINTGSTLTLGANGIDMSAATQDLILSNAITVGPSYQRWNVATGRNLKTGALPGKPGTGAATEGIVEFSSSGTINLSTLNSLTVVDSQGNPWATYGLSDWAATDASGNVIAASYTAVSASTATTFIQNADITGSYTQSGGNGVFGSMRFASPTTAFTVNCGNTTFTPRGVLVAPGCAGASIINGFMRPNRSLTTAATSFDFIQNSTVGDLTISVNLANGSSSAPVKVVKAGSGKMIITVAGGYTGGTVVHAGTLQVNTGATLGASAGAGAVVVNAGRLLYQSGANQGIPSVTINNTGTNSLSVVAANGSSYVGTNLLLSAGNTRLEFSWNTGVALSAATAPMQVSGLTNSGTAVIDIFAGALAVGQYPLIKYTTSGGAGSYVMGSMPLRTAGHIVTNLVNSTIDLVVDSVNQPIFWGVGSGAWDLATTANWKTNGVATTYQQVTTVFGSFGDAVQFEDTQSGGSPITVTLNANLAPATVTVTNTSKAYTISGSGSVGGASSLTKSGSGTLTVNTANSFSGGLNLNGGILSFSALTNLGAGAINFAGGTLQYNGNSDDISVRTVTFNAGGATIDTAGNTVTFASPVGNSGAGGLTKTGAGTLTLTGTNKYTGNTVVANGTLALAGNTFITNSPAIIVNGGATLDASAVGLTFRGASPQILAGAGAVNGSVVSSNGVITPGTNGTVGTLTFGNDLTLAGGSLVIDLSTNTAQRDLVVVGGNLAFYGGSLNLNVTGTLTNGVYKLIQYTGSLNSGAGSSANLLLTGYTQAGKVLALSDAVAGEIDLIVSSQGGANITWQGNGVNPNNWDIETTANFTNASGAAVNFVQGDKPTFDDTAVNPNVSLMGNLQPGSVTVAANANNFIFSDGVGGGAGKLSGSTTLTKNGSGTLTIATANVNSGKTVINGGTLQVGNGGTLGDLGLGDVTNNAALVYAQSDNHTQVGAIVGTGSLTQSGGGTLTLAANNSYAGPTVITSGSLQVGTGGATGSLGSGAVTNDGTLIYNKTGTFAVGNIKTGPGNAGALTFAGAATVTLNNGNTYINNTAVNGGVVKLSAAEVIPSATTVPGSTGWLVLDGGATAGTLDLNGFDQTANALSGLGGAVVGVITNSGTSLTTTNTLTVGTAATIFNGAIVDNASGNKTRLVIRGNSSLRMNGSSTYKGETILQDTATLIFGPGGFVGNGGNIIMSNGTTINMLNQGSTSVFPGNTLIMPDGGAGNITSSSQANGFGGLVVGSAISTNIIGANVSFGTGNVKQFQSMNGNVQIALGGSLRFSSTGLTVNGGDNTTFDVLGSINTRNGTANGAGISLGALTGTGSLNGAGNADGNGVYVIGAKGIDTTFSGSISGVVPRNTSIVKTGAGTLTLDGTLSYDGSTTINGGVLKIASLANQGTSLNASPSINISANAVLDVSDRSDATLNLGSAIAQTLTGFGTIRGSLNQASNSTVSVGLGILNVTNVATLNGTLNMQLNRTNAITASKLVASSFVNASALTVTNVGPALQGGDTFTLFSGAISGFTVTNLPALTGTLYWTNNLAVNGTIAVVNPVATNPTNITSSVSGNVLSLSWPADHTGWKLQIQTNGLSTGLSTNWVTLPGSELVNSTNLTINPANGAVFYRMVYP